MSGQSGAENVSRYRLTAKENNRVGRSQPPKYLLEFGIPETVGETTDDLKNKVLQDVFHEHLGVKVNTVERMGRHRQKRIGKVRSVIIRLFDYNEKINLFRNFYKLKGSDYSLRNG